MDADPVLRARVEAAITTLVDDGARHSVALTALVVALEDQDGAPLVVDMVEEGLDRASQHAMRRALLRRGPHAPPLFLMTRSNVILDLATAVASETVIFCPPNHSRPYQVMPVMGSQGFDAVASCLGAPEVRARTEGMVAWIPPAV